MRRLIVIALLFTYLGVISQQKNNAPPRPAIPINSLQLNIQLIKGKEFYSFLKKEKKEIKDDKKYSIWIHEVVKKKKYKIGHNVEGNDIPSPSSNFIKGKYAGFDEIGSFKKGYKNGFWKTLYKNKLVKTINYKNGLVIGRYRVYDTKGNLLYKTTFSSQGNGKFKDYYYKTGVLKQEGNYENGKKQGEWCTYDKQGEMIKNTIYNKGMPKKE